MTKKNIFDEWFDNYFCNSQGEDSPYRYEDVKCAFMDGYVQGRLSLVHHKRRG